MEENIEIKTDVSKVEAPPVESRTPAWLVVFLLLFFWPLALYFMYKDKKYHSWIAFLLIFIGVVMAGMNGALAFFVIPQLSSLYRSLSIDYSITLPLVVSLFVFAANIAAVVLGIVLLNKLRFSKIYPAKLVSISTIVFALSLTLSVIGPMAATAPIYELINRLYSDQPLQATCTMEAKLCPDGTSVGRSGPSCEFAPCPVASPSAILSNWKTYNNQTLKYEIKYPPNLTIKIPENCDDCLILYLDPNNKEYIQIQSGSISSMGREYTINDATLHKPNATRTTVNGEEAVSYRGEYTNGVWAYKGIDFFPTDIKYFPVKFEYIGDGSNEKLVDQILSTFKFTAASASPTQAVACTMEAKLCPDGSSVGRSGPKCDFAKCPGEI